MLNEKFHWRKNKNTESVSIGKRTFNLLRRRKSSNIVVSPIRRLIQKTLARSQVFGEVVDVGDTINVPRQVLGSSNSLFKPRGSSNSAGFQMKCDASTTF